MKYCDPYKTWRLPIIGVACSTVALAATLTFLFFAILWE